MPIISLALSNICGHAEVMRMYNSMRREYDWLYMANDLYTNVRDCHGCAQNKPSYERWRAQQLFPGSGSLELVAMDILGLLWRCYTATNMYGIDGSILQTNKSQTYVQNDCVTHCIPFDGQINYTARYTDALLTENGTQFVIKIFNSLCTFLLTKHLVTTAYHPWTNQQAKQFNKTMTTRLPHYAAELQRDWDTYVQHLTYVYNAQVHCTTNFPPSGLVLWQQPPVATTFDSPTALPSDAMVTTSSQVLPAQLLPGVATMRRATDRWMKTAQRRYKGEHDKKIRKASQMFNAGKYVYVDRPPVTASAGEILAPDSYSEVVSLKGDPFRVVKVLPSTVTIDKDGISDTVLIYRLALAPTRTTVQNVMNNSINRSRDDQPTGTMRPSVHQGMWWTPSLTRRTRGETNATTTTTTTS